jgi:formate hydrogenlyase transcriptional activator
MDRGAAFLFDPRPVRRELDDLLRLAARICGVPAAFVVMADGRGQLGVAAQLGVGEDEREAAGTACRALAPVTDPVMIPDTRSDPRLAENPLFHGPQAFQMIALAPLALLEGWLVVLDREPRALAADQVADLGVLARFAAAQQRERFLLAVNNAVVTSLTREALMKSTTEALRLVVPFDRAAMTIYDPVDKVLRIAALQGPLPPQGFGVGAVIDLADSHVGWSFTHQRTLLRRDLAREREFTPEHRLYDEGIRSLCTAPLAMSGKSIGTITVGSRTPDRYSAVEEEFLGEVAKQIALGVSNMQAYEEISALQARVAAENRYLKDEIRIEHNQSELIGASPAWRAVLESVQQVAGTDSTVLISGETGTGKELIARALHDLSPRKDHALVRVNCGAISAGLVESELFGHVKGAFTGALAAREGRFALADGGTIFLDEVGELPPDTQVKLLRVVQEQEFEPVGSSTTVRVNVRVVAATNRDLSAAVAAGRFRGDLYYRLAVVPIHVPPLRERPGDVRLLASFLVQKIARRLGRPVPSISERTMEMLAEYDWPGNVRELQNVIERAVVLSRGDSLTIPESLPASRDRSPSTDAATTLEEAERRHIERVLREKNWTIEGERGAARALDIHPNTLRSRLQKLGIRRPP